MQTFNQPGAVTPQQLGFQPLGAAASGAPPPMLMPGQTGYQQQPYGYSVSTQQFPQQQYQQQLYPQQYPQQYPAQFPMSQPYGGQQYPQSSYSVPMYNQAPPMYNQAAPMYNQAAPMYNQAAPMYNQAVPPYGYAQPGDQSFNLLLTRSGLLLHLTYISNFQLTTSWAHAGAVSTD